MTDDTARAKAEPRLYAIGDIHGCTDLLDRIIDHIHRDLTGIRAPNASR